jgi:hypothetical protein
MPIHFGIDPLPLSLFVVPKRTTLDFLYTPPNRSPPLIFTIIHPPHLFHQPIHHPTDQPPAMTRSPKSVKFKSNLTDFYHPSPIITHFCPFLDGDVENQSKIS